MRDSKTGSGIVIVLAIFITLLMMFSSLSSAFYYNSPTGNITSSDSQNIHTYLVTTNVNRQNYTYYEEVKNGKIIKTWPAPSVIQGNFTDDSNYAGQFSLTSSRNFIPTALKSSSSEQSIGGPPPPDPFTVSITPSTATIDKGQSITFTNSTSGGTPPPYHYTWAVTLNGPSASGTYSQSTNTFTFNSVGTYKVFLNVTDSTPGPAGSASATATVAVDSTPSISTQPSSATIDAGQSISLSSTVTGGTGSFSWTLYSGASTVVATGSGLTASYSVSPTSTTSYHFVFTDTGTTPGATPTITATSNTVTVTVNPLLSVSISPSSATIDAGQSITFTSIITTGTSPYSYSWTLGGSTAVVSTSSSYTFSNQAGTYKIWLNVTDNTGALSSASAQITVLSPPVASISPSSSTIDVSQSVTLTSSVTGGTGSFSYLWYLNGSATSVTTLTYTLIPNGKGTYSIYVVITDTGTAPGATPPVTATSNIATITVGSGLVVSVMPSSVAMDIGQSTTLTASAFGGTAPYSYLWYENGSSTTVTASTYTLTPAGKGTYTIYVVVTDSSTTPLTKDSPTVTITVNSPPTVSISPSSAVIDAGQSIILSPEIAGGTSYISYQWYESTVSSTSNFVEISQLSNYDFTISTAGNYYFYLVITDSGSGASPAISATSGTVTIKIDSALAVSVSPISGTMDKGQSLSISGAASGGTGTYSYSWEVNGVTQSGIVSSFTFTPATAGTFTIEFLVTDMGVSNLASPNPYAVTASAQITVLSPPVASISPSSSTIDIGQSVTLTSTVTGGTGTFSYLWYLNGTATSITTQTYTFTPNGKGTYSIYVVVTDTGTGSASPTITAASKGATVTVGGNTFSVTFNENGLPSGTRWYVDLTNGQTFSEQSPTIGFPEINGTYYYTIATANTSYKPSPYAGSFSIVGSSVSITITFTEVIYQVKITETGLPQGTNWYVNITGSQTSSALVTGSSYSISLPNGTYSYSIATGNKEYSPSPYTGSFTVNGLPVSIPVTFNLVTYAISFIENGLPAGTEWYVNLTNGQTFSNLPTTISFVEPNGTYSFMIASNDPLYGAYPALGSFVVKGGSISEHISFLRLYSVTITETGLPLGTKWYLNLTDPESFNSTTESITFFEPNGTYNYTVSSSNKAYQPILTSQVGSFSVNGIAVSSLAPSQFVELFSVMFTETSLPPGTIWYLNISGGKTFSSSSPVISFRVPNGTYQFTIATGNKEYKPSLYSGSVEVSGTSVSMAEKFDLVTYAVTFGETGFTNGTTWSITLNNVTKQSTNGSIIFDLVNGSYQFSIQAIPGFATAEYSGNVTVDGSALFNSLNWTMLTYPIKITQSGITVGDRWSVTLEGTAFNGLPVNLTVNTTKSSVTFQVPNGSYSYTIQAPFGYTGTHMSGSFNVSGAAAGTTALLQPPNFALIAIAGALAMVVLTTALALLIRKQNRSFFIREERFLKHGRKS